MRLGSFKLGLGVLAVIGAGFVWQRMDAIAVGMLIGIAQVERPRLAPPSDVRQSVDVTSDGATLRAWVLDPPKPAAVRGTIVILHGIRDSKLSSLAAARSH